MKLAPVKIEEETENRYTERYTTEGYTFFSRAYGMFSRIDNFIGQNKS
jgi:hypothetical protein